MGRCLDPPDRRSRPSWRPGKPPAIGQKALDVARSTPPRSAAEAARTSAGSPFTLVPLAEPVLGDPRALRSGDVVRVGRIDLVYVDGLETPARRLALLRPPEGAPPVEVLSRSAAEDTPVLQSQPCWHPAGRWPIPLPLAPAQLAWSTVAAAVTALVLSGLHVDRLGQSWLGAMGAAALASVVATVIQTRGRGQWWRLVGGAGLAFALAVTGISLPELGLHRALTNSNRPATFVPPELTPSTTATTTTTEPLSGPHISTNPERTDLCPDTVVGGQGTECPVVTIRSTGSESLLVT